MSIVVAVGLGILALAFVLYPLYRRPSIEAPAVASKIEARDADEPQEREQAARQALHEVELDYQLGNLSEKDYGVLRERYMRHALVALKSRYDREQELDEMIEEQLKQIKEKSSDQAQ
ncbi:hypothetical protein EPA93_36700 [Ktedonosporobacter rubrisoli]|uniref:C-type cytochrome biogenesis protein CcmI n=1 Tax=Ktedonosporobacter rubrisoli TaxID=2509675 RepID=A0A4P6K0C3_KTERU|nr:hypothetical protein [Ktedonosporobacter rubrisoli]QBD81222.1 hypothetical protein EPA93_36700 [Ktedonosporobacter rubrisoli]